MIRLIKVLGDSCLHEVSAPVLKNRRVLKALVNDMFDTMYEAEGIGLAAVQVGMLKRIFVIDIESVSERPLVCVNPILLRVSHDTIESLEGCLSVPGIKLPVKRHRSVIIKYSDLAYEEYTLKAQDLLSICIQHEIDHLNGILFLDRLSKKDKKEAHVLLKEKGYPEVLHKPKKGLSARG